MNQLQTYTNPEFGELSVIEIGGKPYFPATECAKILGYSDPYDAVKRHTKGSVKHRVLTAGGEQQIKCIPEGDLYRLLARSQLPAAERFECWVFLNGHYFVKIIDFFVELKYNWLMKCYRKREGLEHIRCISLA